MQDKNASIPSAERIEFRIGIHQGDIVVEDGDIFGDGVNIAARLEGIADPGAYAFRRAYRKMQLAASISIFRILASPS